MAFLTGSRVYGTPREDSDIDIVVHLESEEISQLLDKEYSTNNNYNATSASIRFGNLNLICMSDHQEYLAWYQATKELKARKPVTRDEAIAHIIATVDAHKLLGVA